MSKLSAAITYYLERFREGDFDAAFHGLRELDHAILPELAERFRNATDPSLRVFLLHVSWQHRQSSVIPLLAEALHDSDPEVWKEAMDGLVVLGGEEAVNALRQARTQSFATAAAKQPFNEWLAEAIEQAQAQRRS